MLQPITKPLEILFGAARHAASGLQWLHGRLRRPAYGAASWASQSQLNRVPTGFALGKLGGWRLQPRPVFADPESCIIMVGQRGAGKSLTMGASLHHASGDTLLVFDPPGQLLATHADALRERGYRLVHIDLDNPLAGVPFDPMVLLEGSTRYTFERDVDTLARLVIGEVEGSGDSAAQHFAEMGVNLIAGVIAHLWSHAREQCTMAEVARILSVGGPARRRKAFERMAAEASNSVTRAAVNAFEEAGDRERGSFATTLMRKLKPWTQAVALDLCKREVGWTFDELFTLAEPVAVFLTGGVGAREATSPLTRMIVGQAAATLSRLYNETRTPLARPVKLLLDEADNLGACAPLINIVTELRKQRVTAFLCVQSLEQLKRNYRGQYQTLLQNADLIVCGGMKSPKEYLEISQLIGTRTVNPITKGPSSVSVGEAPRALMGIDDLFAMPKTEHVAVLNGMAVKLLKPYTLRGGRVWYGRR
ncbi:MAG: type IV secretory system conjugative DNA transfer family protein [Nitrospiraceae bacterium]